ncbi:hypothetical protein [Fodinibius sp. AD559]|uniref:hypothetical protein n=1 Tax=Fodinibius sp. AD559 TaxID=3424179 RepID=UPI004046BCEE
MDTCHFEGCETQPNEHLFIDGDPYCSPHYNIVLEDRLKESFQNWDGDSDQDFENFRKYLARLSDEQRWTTKGDSFLSQYRIKKRAYDFEKTDEGCEFKIERHLNTWEGTGKQRDVIEHWRANIEDKVLVLLDKTNSS